MTTVSLHALSGIPDIHPGHDLSDVVSDAASRNAIPLEDDDVIVVAQKIVSKAEDRYVDLREIVPTAMAVELSEVCEKDPRIVELILRESQEIVRCRPGVIIARHRLGLVLANAGIDQSNLPSNEEGDRVLLLPVDPDKSADELRLSLAKKTGRALGVVVIDSIGRAWRNGTVGTCIGASGIGTLCDMRGERDFYGRTLQSTVVGTGDELAAAGSLIMGQGAEGTPIVIVRGMKLSHREGSSRELVRPLKEDLFR